VEKAVVKVIAAACPNKLKKRQTANLKYVTAILQYVSERFSVFR